MSFSIKSPVDSFSIDEFTIELSDLITTTATTAKLSAYFQLNSFAALRYPDLYQHISHLLTPPTQPNDLKNPSPTTQFTILLTKILLKAFRIWATQIHPTITPLPTSDTPIQHPFLSYIYQLISYLFTIEAKCLEQRLTTIAVSFDSYSTQHYPLQLPQLPLTNFPDTSMNDSPTPVESAKTFNQILEIPTLQSFLLPYGNTNISSLITSKSTTPQAETTSQTQYLSNLLSFRQSSIVSTLTSIFSKIVISPDNILNSTTDSNICIDNVQLSDEVFREVSKTSPASGSFVTAIMFMIANAPLATSPSTPISSSHLSQYAYIPTQPPPQLSLNFLLPHSLAKLPQLALLSLSQVADSKNFLGLWRKGYVTTFTNFQRFNLFLDGLEGYSKVLSSIQTAMLGVIASFQSIYLTLSHHVKIAVAKDDPHSLPIYCTCCEHFPSSDNFSIDPSHEPPAHLSIPTQRTLMPYYLHNHIVAQLLPHITSGKLSSKSPFLPTELQCPVVQLFIDAYLSAVNKLRTTLLQLIGAFNLDNSKVLDLLIVVYLYTSYYNTSVNTFSDGILSQQWNRSSSIPTKAEPMLTNDTSNTDDASNSGISTFLAEQFPQDSILSLLSPVSTLFGEHPDPALTSATGHPSLQLLVSPSTLLFFGVISLFHNDVLITTIGTQLTLFSGSSNPLLGDSTCGSTMPEFISSSLTSTPSDNTQFPTQSIWVPIVYLAGLLVHYQTISYQSLSFYIDPLGVSLTTLSQKSYSIMGMVKEAIKNLTVTRLTDSNNRGNTNPFSQPGELLAQLEAIGGFDPSGYLASPGQIGSHLAQTINDRTTEPMLILFSTLFSFDAYFYILRLYQAFTTAHRSRQDYIIPDSPYLSLDTCRASTMSRIVYSVAPYQINFDSYVTSLIPHSIPEQTHYKPINNSDDTRSFNTVAWPFIPLYSASPQQLLQMVDSKLAEEEISAAKNAQSTDSSNSPSLLDDDDELMMMLMGGSSSSSMQTRPETLTYSLPIYPFLSLSPFSTPSASPSSTTPLRSFSQLDLFYLQFAQCGDLILLFNNEALERQLYSTNPLSAYSTPQSPLPKLATIVYQTQLHALSAPHRFLMPQTYRASTTTTISSNHFFNSLISRLHAFMLTMKPLIGVLQQLYLKQSVGSSPLPALSLSTIKLIMQHLLCITSPLRCYLAVSPSLFKQLCSFISLLLFHVKTLLQLQSEHPQQTTTTTNSSQHQIPQLSLKRSLHIGSSVHPTPLALSVPIVNTSIDDDNNREFSNMSTLYEFFTLISHIIFPTHALLPGSADNNETLWSILSHLSYGDRFACYALQQSHQKSGYLYSTAAEQFAYTQYISRTKYCRKRLANDKVQETSTLASKFLLPAPLISLDLLLENYKTFPSLAQPLIELCANQSPLLYDIFIYLIVGNINTQFESTYNHQASYPLTMDTTVLDRCCALYISLHHNYPSNVDLQPLLDIFKLFVPVGKLTTSSSLTQLFQTLANITPDEDFQFDKIKFSTSSFFLSYLSQPTTFTFDNIIAQSKQLSSLFSTLNLPQLYTSARPVSFYPNVTRLNHFTTPISMDKCIPYGFTNDITPSTSSPQQAAQQSYNRFIGPTDKTPIRFAALHIHQTPSHLLHYHPRIILHFNTTASATTFSTPNSSLPQAHLSLTTSPLHPLVRYQHRTHPDLISTVPFFGSSLLFPPQALPLTQSYTYSSYSLLLSILGIYHNMVSTASNIADHVPLSTLLDKTMNNITVLRQFISYYCDFGAILKFINPLNGCNMVRSIYDIYLGMKIDSVGIVLHLYRQIMYRYPEVLDYTLNVNANSNLSSTGVPPRPSISLTQRKFLETIHRSEPISLITQHATLIQFIPQSFVHFIDLCYHNYLYFKDEMLLDQVTITPHVSQDSSLLPASISSLLPRHCAPVSPLPIHHIHFFAFFWYYHSQHFHHDISHIVQPHLSLPPPPVTNNSNKLSSRSKIPPIEDSPQPGASTISSATHTLYQPLLKTLSYKRGQAFNSMNDPKQQSTKEIREFEFQLLENQIAECYYQIQYQQFLFQTHRHFFNSVSIIPFPQRIPNDVTLPQGITTSEEDGAHIIISPSQFNQLPIAIQANLLSLPHNMAIIRLFTITFVQTCILPRIILSSTDAYYCAHFIHSLRKSTCIGFNFQLFTQLFIDELELLMIRTTKNEAQRVGVFLNELFYYIPLLNPTSSTIQSGPIFESPVFHEFTSFTTGWLDLTPSNIQFDYSITHPALQSSVPSQQLFTKPHGDQLSRVSFFTFDRITKLLVNSISACIATFPVTLSIPNTKFQPHPAMTTPRTDISSRELKEKMVLSLLTLVGKLQVFPHFATQGEQLISALGTLVTLYDTRQANMDYIIDRSSASTMYSTVNNIRNMYSAQQRSNQWSEYSSPTKSTQVHSNTSQLAKKIPSAASIAASSKSEPTPSTKSTITAPTLATSNFSPTQVAKLTTLIGTIGSKDDKDETSALRNPRKK